jgi:pyruvate dehydrogenase (quinone)
MLSLRFPAEVNLHGDAAETLRLLVPLLQPQADRSWRDSIEKGVQDWWKKLEGRAKANADPVNPQRVVWEMSPLLPANTIVTSDSGSCANWYARDFRVQRGQSASLSGGLASMGAAVPYAIAAKFAFPHRPVVALVGDGAMQMNNMAELITVQKYWRQWSDPRWIVCVFNNEDLNEVTWEQRIMEGDPKFVASQVIPNFAYARFGEMLGFRAIFIDKPDDLHGAWQQALSSDRPVVLEVKTDPDVAPLPPHVTLKEARGFMASIVKGDPSAGHMIADTARQLLGDIIHGKD